MTYRQWQKTFVDGGDKSGIINLLGDGAVSKIGEINPKHFEKDFSLLTNEVVVTGRQIEHIKKRHPMDFERFARHIPEILRNPDYIIEANLPNSAILLKEFPNDERFQLVLRLKSGSDPSRYENSVITFMRMGENRYNQMVRNKKILYSSI